MASHVPTYTSALPLPLQTLRCFQNAPQAALGGARVATLGGVKQWFSRFSWIFHKRLFDIPRMSASHDIARQGPWRLALPRISWRFWFVALAPGGRYFLLATILFFLYGGLTFEAGAFVPLMYALAAWVMAYFARILERPRVAIAARHAERIAASASRRASHCPSVSRFAIEAAVHYRARA